MPLERRGTSNIHSGQGYNGEGPAISPSGQRIGVPKTTPPPTAVFGGLSSRSPARHESMAGDRAPFQTGFGTSRGMSTPDAPQNGSGGLPMRGANTQGAGKNPPPVRKVVGYKAP